MKPALRRGGREPSHYQRAKLFMSELPLLDRREGDLHHALELDIDALREHRSSARR